MVAKLQNFCSEDLGGFYLDIIKDRLYTSAPNSAPRRAAQTALYHIAHRVIRTMAPILSFTAEEAWAVLMNTPEDATIFTELNYVLPTINQADALINRWSRIRALRDDVNKALEHARTEGKIGSALQAAVVIQAPASDAELLQSLGDELRFVLITSAASVHTSAALNVQVNVAVGNKCERCWHVSVEVGTVADHPSLCPRCASNLFGAGETRRSA